MISGPKLKRDGLSVLVHLEVNRTDSKAVPSNRLAQNLMWAPVAQIRLKEGIVNVSVVVHSTNRDRGRAWSTLASGQIAGYGPIMRFV